MPPWAKLSDDVGRDGLTTKVSGHLVDSFSSMLFAVQPRRVLTDTVLHTQPQKTLRRREGSLGPGCVYRFFCFLYVNTTLFGCRFFFFVASGEVEPFVFSLKISPSTAADVVYTLPFSFSQTCAHMPTHNRLFPFTQIAVSLVGCAWGKKATVVI